MGNWNRELSNKDESIVKIQKVIMLTCHPDWIEVELTVGMLALRFVWASWHKWGKGARAQWQRPAYHAQGLGTVPSTGKKDTRMKKMKMSQKWHQQKTSHRFQSEKETNFWTYFILEAQKIKIWKLILSIESYTRRQASIISKTFDKFVTKKWHFLSF